MKKTELKSTKEINPKIISKMKEGYSQRKAISVAEIKNNNSKKK